MKTLEDRIIEWGNEKGILGSSTPAKQLQKTMEEIGELIAALDDKNEDEIIDAYGDIVVTLILGAAMQGLSLEECTQSAYNVITKRTGKMVNGIFVKDGDDTAPQPFLSCGEKYEESGSAFWFLK